MEKLVTLAEYKTLNPVEQGFVIYWEAEQPGSELKSYQSNPYPPHSKEWSGWNFGQRKAILAVIDEVE